MKVDMQYRQDKYGNSLSVLGYGCMRFNRTPGGVDMKKTEEEILAAVDAGINYFDTAYIYPGSEAALGEILEKNRLRDRVNIATKLPHYMIRRPEDAEKFFSEELRRLRTDRVDYYLMHMLTDDATWERLLSLGVADWIEKKKASGQIRQVGFSYHGNSDVFCRIVDAYDWDFCMIQYNYLDENAQAGVTGLKYASGRGLPVMIMEPLRGGRLVSGLPRDALKMMESHKTKKTPAEWSFSWLWNQPEVTVVLSGMNSLEMIRENAEAADRSLPGCLDGEDRALLERVKDAINSKMRVGCTGCRYCMPCPQGVDIPGSFAAFNRASYDGYYRGLKDYFMCTALRREKTAASKCIGCGKCEKHCPQSIAIRDELKRVKKSFETPLYRIASKAAPLFVKY